MQECKRLLKRWNSQSGLLLPAMLALVVVGYSMLYFSNTYPISEGWGINYAELIFQGKMPYRDFYYYLPPLNLLIDMVFWKLSFGSLLMFRGWYLLQRVCLYLLLFHVLKKYFNKYYVFLACVFTVFLATGDVYDLIGDYNQTMCLLALILVCCDINYVKAEGKRKFLHLAWGGFVLGCLFLNKQTIFVACCVTHFVALCITCFIRRDRNFLKYCASVAVGMSVPIGITCIFLGINGALIPFIEQIFLNVDGKGGLFSILVQSITDRFWQPSVLALCLIVAGLVVSEKQQTQNMLTSATHSAAASWLLLIGILLLYYSSQAYFEINAFVKMLPKYRSAMAAIAFACGISLAGGIYLRKKQNQGKGRKEEVIVFTSVLALFAMLAVCIYSMNFSKELYESNKMIFDMVQNSVSSILFISIIIVTVIYALKYKHLLSDANAKRYEGLLYLCCGAFSLLYAGAMASGDTPFAALCIRIAFPLMVCLLLSSKMKHDSISCVLKYGLICICIVLSMACVSQKQACSYSWWGTTMKPSNEKVYSANIPAMKGIKMSEEQKELYETISDIIIEHTDEDAVIWGYPHIKLFNILTGRYNMDTFVPVLFYDVVADVYVERELDLLHENKPDVIIWEDIAGCIETHERVFRDGKELKQREIEQYLYSILPDEYTSMTTVGNVHLYIKNESIR